MVSPAFCSNCGRPLVGLGPCTACAGTPDVTDDVATVAPVSAPGYETASTNGSYGGRMLPTSAPSSAYGGGHAGAGSFAYGGAATGAPDLSRYTGMWNWGAFLLCPFWLMNHGAVPLGIVALVLSFVPLVNAVSSLGFGIYFGIKGNEWAASHRTFASDGQFVAVQNAWRNWGIGLAILGFALTFAAFVLVGMAHALVHAMR